MRNRLDRRWALALWILLLMGGVALLTGCGATAVTPTVPAVARTLPPPTDLPTPVPEGVAAGTLAASGQEVFAAECAECHGEQGEGLVGPTLLGEAANLDVFASAQGLYDFVHAAMPQDAPGSLADEQYLAVVTYLLLENQMVQPEAPISPEGLSAILLQ